MSLLNYATDHWRRVREFMQHIGQQCPDTPQVPVAKKTCELRVRLVLEEAFELAEAYGVQIRCDGDVIDADALQLEAVTLPNLVEIVDAHADISVVNIGGLIACGMPDIPVLETVDSNNLLKIANGHRNEETGKWEKSPDHPKPNFNVPISTVRRGY